MNRKRYLLGKPKNKLHLFGYKIDWLVVLGLAWLVGCFGFTGPLRQYFSLYPAVPQRSGEMREKIE